VNSNGADSDNGGDRGDEDRGVFRGGGYRGPRRPRSWARTARCRDPHWPRLGDPGITIVAVLILLGSSYLWRRPVTDAIWFQSVGYASVFWTQVGSQLGLFALGAIGGFLVLWFNLWLPGRSFPRARCAGSRSTTSSIASTSIATPAATAADPSALRRGRLRPGRRRDPGRCRPVFWGLLGLSALVALGSEACSPATGRPSSCSSIACRLLRPTLPSA